jgi:hypothetical protein
MTVTLSATPPPHVVSLVVIISWSLHVILLHMTRVFVRYRKYIDIVKLAADCSV